MNVLIFIDLLVGTLSSINNKRYWCNSLAPKITKLISILLGLCKVYNSVLVWKHYH